ncbi:hypothetical protein ASC75_02480 [Aminobacter sp. DSM 101952]|nr:hypothetical protein ASC75_02480 [Aminobacter sp. DSM 101952]
MPKQLRSTIGAEFLTESLKTTDLKEASRLASYVVQKHQQRLDDAAGRLVVEDNSRKLDDLPTHEIEKIVMEWFRSGYMAAVSAFAGEDAYQRPEDEFATRAELQEYRERLVRKISFLTIPDHPSHSELLRSTVNHLIRANGLAYRQKVVGGIAIASHLELVANRSGWKYRVFTDLIRRGVKSLLEQEVAQIAAIPATITDPEFQEVVETPRRRGKRTVTLGELIEEFKTDARRGPMRKKVELDYSLLFRVMDEVIGFDQRLRNINRDDCKAVRDILVKLPPNSTKIYGGYTFAEAVEKGAADERPVLSGTTVNSYLHKMSTLFNFAVAEERMERNPAKSLALSGHDHTEEDRKPFSDAQLKSIFAAPIFTGCENDGRGWAKVGASRPRGTKFWIPLIGLYHGMRLNEICQLRADDFYKVDSVWVFDVRTTEDGSRVKSEAGRRKVPLHPQIEALGFVDFHKKASKGRDARPFPDLRRDSRGYYSDSFQKWFAHLLDKQGAREPKTSFHSFRHNWRDAMREAAVPQERVRLLGGWKRTEVDERYGSNLSLKALYSEMGKVAYPKLDLDKLL